MKSIMSQLESTNSVAVMHKPFTTIEWTDGTTCHTYLLANSDLILLADKLVVLSLVQAINSEEARVCRKLHYPG
jgi:hypothetical protein